MNYIFKLKKLHTGKNPFNLFKKIYRIFDRVFIFESLTGPRELSEYSIIGFDPDMIVKCDNSRFRVTNSEGLLIQESDVHDPIAQLRQIMPRVTTDKYRFTGGAVGYVSYDAIRYWEHLPQLRKRSQDQFEMNENEFISKVERAREHIYQGDIFQVVISRKFNFRLHGDPLAMYERLRNLNPSPYMYFMKQKNNYIIGSSPEMLLRSYSKNVETYPIAGTRPITRNEKLNRSLSKDLLSDEKEISEHTMLVDLARNDLGKICTYGSIKTEKLMTIKRFSHVQHIVSHVKGTLGNNNDCFDAFKALFPAGTVTGAPKVRAMEIIDELEPTLRGPYSGALGYFSFNKACDFAITIRSLFINNNNAFVQAGAGIVMDSIPQKEWEETKHKAEVIFSALKLASKSN